MPIRSKGIKSGLNLGVYPKIFGYPFGMGIIIGVLFIASTFIAMPTKSFWPFLPTVFILLFCELYVKKRYTGNMFFQQKRKFYRHIKTGNLINKLKVEKLIEDYGQREVTEKHRI